VKIHINPTIDVGFNPILPWGETCSFDSLGVFANTVESVWQSIVFDMLGLLEGYVAAKLLSATPAWVPIELLKTAGQSAVLGWSWDNRDMVLGVSLASFLMGLVACSGSVAEKFAKGLFSLAWAGPMSFWYKSMGEMITVVGSVNFFHTWVDVVEILSNFALGVLALAHYLGYI
jgi:hypothetical protein